MRDVITGEAVVVDLPVAKLATRGLAFGIDLAVTGAAYWLVVLLMALVGVLETDLALVAALLIGIGVLIFVGVPVTVETLTRGRSLGKLALGLRVVRDDGGPIAFRHALARGLTGLMVDFGVLSAFTGAIALFASLLSTRGKRVGDMLAGTVVVRERAPVAERDAIGMPPQLAGWAAGLALSQLPDALAANARQFLQRAPELEPSARARFATQFATDVSATVSPPPPPGTPAEPYLAAVLAERSRRATERLTAERASTAADRGDGDGSTWNRPSNPQSTTGWAHPTSASRPAAPAKLAGGEPTFTPPVPAPTTPPPDGGFALPR